MALEYSLSLKGLCLPAVLSDGCGFSVPASGASFMAYVVSAPSAPSAMNVHDFACAFAK
jgi:hypothetical protein